MPGTLYIVATPLGNLGDLSPRVAETLSSADFVAAEDTRVTLKLLNHLGLKKPMVSYHAHNERERAEAILARLEAGESCALCSDAGIPAISDPGEEIVRRALERGATVSPVPGGSAAVTALCVSGQSTARFCFEGFISQNKAQRRAHLDSLKAEQRTMVFYEAPHKLPRTLDDLAAAFGGLRSITLCRELTKLHEEIWKTTLQEAAARYHTEAPRGEFVLVVAGASPPPAAEAPSLQEACAMAQALAQAEQLSASEAARRVAAETGLRKSDVYKAMAEHRNKT